MKQRFLVCVFLLLLAACDTERGKVRPEATVFTASAVLTMNTDYDIVSAVAVSGGKIIAIGNLDDIQALLPNYQVTVDRQFDGKVVMPGFVENHLHPALAGVLLPSTFITPWDWVLPHQQEKMVFSLLGVTTSIFMARWVDPTLTPSVT